MTAPAMTLLHKAKLMPEKSKTHGDIKIQSPAINLIQSNPFIKIKSLTTFA